MGFFILTSGSTLRGKPESSSHGGSQSRLESPPLGPSLMSGQGPQNISLVLARKASLELWLFSHVLQKGVYTPEWELKSITELAFNVKKIKTKKYQAED